MNIKLEKIVLSKDTLVKVLNQDFPIVISYKLSKIVDKINKEIQIFEENRVKLVKKYGEEVKEGFKVKEENIEVYAKELSELLDIEIQIEIPIITIKDLEGCKLSPLELIQLSWLIKEE